MAADELLKFLERANLLTYKDALLEQGADDIEQLKELESDEFEQLCAMVGMDKKPFHVMRLKKALNRHTTPTTPPITTTTTATATTVATVATSKQRPPDDSNNSSRSSKPKPSNTAPSASTGQSANVGYSPNVGSVSPDKLPPTAAAATTVVRPSRSTPKTADSANTTGKTTTTTTTTKGAEDKATTRTLFLPPYLQEDSEGGLTFDELIDDQTPVQKTLGPIPFHPSMWDPGRKELIRKYATIYGKNFNRRQKELLTPFEEQVNEGAYQLCLRDPTLLVRREELFILSKRAVKEGGYTYYHGFPKSKDIEGGNTTASAATTTIAMTGQKRLRPKSSTSHFDIPAAKMLITASDLVDDVPKKMSGRMRQERMTELEKLIAANKAQQEAKLVELEQAQQLCNFSAAFSIQLEVESLGNACQALQSSYTALKRKQRRSDRYYILKERESDETVAGNNVAATAQTSPPQLLTQQSSAGGGECLSPTATTTHNDDASGKETIVGHHHHHHHHHHHPSSSPAAAAAALSKQSASSRKKGGGVVSAGGGGGGGSSPTVTATVIPSSAPGQSSPGVLPGGGGGGGGGAPPRSGNGGGNGGSASHYDDSSNEGDDSEVQDLVKNVSHATDEVNSLMIREFQKQLAWDI